MFKFLIFFWLKNSTEHLADLFTSCIARGFEAPDRVVVVVDLDSVGAAVESFEVVVASFDLVLVRLELT